MLQRMTGRLTSRGVFPNASVDAALAPLVKGAPVVQRAPPAPSAIKRDCGDACALPHPGGERRSLLDALSSGLDRAVASARRFFKTLFG